VLLLGVSAVAAVSKFGPSKEPEPEYTYASFKRREEGPLPEVPKEVWDEARSQFRVRMRELEEHRQRAADRREREAEKEVERRLWAEAVAEAEAEYGEASAPERGLFDLFDLLHQQDNRGGQAVQVDNQEAKALKAHHDQHAEEENTPADPNDPNVKKMMLQVDKLAGKVNPNQGAPATFNADTEAKKAAMAAMLKNGGKRMQHKDPEALKREFEELQTKAKEKANRAKEIFEEKRAAEIKRLKEKQKEEKERLQEQLKQKKLKEQMEILKEREIKAKIHEQRIQTEVSLYCMALMMPFGYEAGLLLEQKKRGVGIFQCDEWAVYSNQSKMANGDPFPFPVHEVKGPHGEPISLFVPLGGRWHTALNRDVFNQLWLKVVEVDDYRKHDWIVKVDPDSVYFPKRLKQVIGRRSPLNGVHNMGPEPENLDCKYCKKQGFTDQPCATHVHWLQSQGHTCRDALMSVARPPPVDCGCQCNDFACDLPSTQAVYINNCQWGLHGPIEVFSRRCIAMYIAGLPICQNLLFHAWGEDIFIDQCMMELGLTRVNEFDVMSEIACGDQPAPCGQTDTTFHPFKNVEKWFACWNFANKYGHGPEDRLAHIVVEQAEILEQLKKKDPDEFEDESK